MAEILVDNDIAMMDQEAFDELPIHSIIEPAFKRPSIGSYWKAKQLSHSRWPYIRWWMGEYVVASKHYGTTSIMWRVIDIV